MTAQEAHDLADANEYTPLEIQAQPIYDLIEAQAKLHKYNLEYVGVIKRQLKDYLVDVKKFVITESNYTIESQPIYIISWESPLP